MSATLSGRSAQELQARDFPYVPRARGAGAVVMARCGFPGEKSHVAQARRFVRSTLGLCPAIPPEMLDTALLLVSEVASNAIRHTRSGEAGGRFGVEVHHSPGHLTVAVHDEGPRGEDPGAHPTVKRFSPDSEGGRGLAIIDAVASEWDTEAVPGGRVVAFTLSPGGARD
ncbi:ATP-binding protein [Nocardiopsis potens]|uniref:ATP-binding protein n=1 Tax=Nocardiopsis potens TaxID=1246458 RepID=UPI000349A079|nr:ATP-binding protein [Nocardiopsis potens]